MCSFVCVSAAIDYYLVTVRTGSPPPDITLTNGRTRLLLQNYRRGRDGRFYQFLNHRRGRRRSRRRNHRRGRRRDSRRNRRRLV
jgi:hypothetical protein